MNSNTLIVHIEVDSLDVDEILDFLSDNEVLINSISTKELFDQLNYIGRGYKC